MTQFFHNHGFHLTCDDSRGELTPRGHLKGHPRSQRSSTVFEFLPITFDWKEIQRRGWSHCVSLVETLQMICNMTYFGDLDLDLDLDPRSNFDLDLLRSKDTFSEASRRAEHDGAIFIFVSLLSKKLLPKNNLREKRIFFLWWPLEPKLLTLGQIWRCWGLKRATRCFFRIPPSCHTFWDICECLRKNRDFLNIWPLVTSGDLNVDLGEKMTEILS